VHPQFVTHRFGAGGGVASSSLPESDVSFLRTAFRSDFVSNRAEWLVAVLTEGDCDTSRDQVCISEEEGRFKCEESGHGCHPNYAPGLCSSHHRSGCRSSPGDETAFVIAQNAHSTVNAIAALRVVTDNYIFGMNARSLQFFDCAGRTIANIALTPVLRSALDRLLSGDRSVRMVVGAE